MRYLYVVDGIGRLIFETKEELARPTAVHLTLHVGSESFDFADAGSWHLDYDYSDNYYWWSGTDLSWAGDDAIDLRLTALPYLSEGVVTAPVDNLRATVKWGEVQLRWDALDTEMTKRCSKAGGISAILSIARQSATTSAGLDTAPSDFITPEGFARANTFYSDIDGVDLGRYYRYEVRSWCNIAGSIHKHSSLTSHPPLDKRASDRPPLG